MRAQEVDMKQLQPRNYLKNGFLNNNGDLQDGISGVYSLALAYHLRKEGTSVDAVKSVLDDFAKLADQGLNEKTLKSQLDATSFESLGKIINSSKAGKSTAISALFDAALPLLKDWPNVGGLVIHLDRAMKQLSLITVTSRMS
jgi:hypothetical protein